MNICFTDASTLGKDISFEGFGKFGTVTVYDGTSGEECPSHIREADVLIVNKFRCHPDTLKEAPRLKLICLAATGFDNVDLDYCREKGIAVANVVGYSTDSVAQVTAATVLSLACRLPVYDAYTKSGKYTASGVANAITPVYRELAGKTWGILGAGNIGRKVGQIAEALGCRVLFCRKQSSQEENCVSLDKLCRESDVLTLHLPLNPETRGILDASHIAMLKPDVILVNEARGAVLDEAAVAKALSEGKIGAFGCDVYSKEPFGKDHPFAALLSLPNVIFTPHMAWGAYEARVRCMEEIGRNIEAFIRGERRNRVD